MRHLREVRDTVAPDQVLPQCERHFGGGVDELRRFDLFTQRNRHSMRVRHFDAYRGLAGDALDQNGLRLQRQAEVLRKTRNPAVFDPRLGLELVRGDHRTWISLRDAPADIELLALLLDG